LLENIYIYSHQTDELIGLSYTPTEANDERTRHELSRTDQRKLKTYNQVQKEDKVIGVNVKKIVALIVASCIGWVGIADAAEAPRQIDRVQKQVSEVEMRQHFFDYVPEKRRTVPAWAKCPEIWNRLRDAGWLEKDVVKADQIVWRESRCIATAHNKKDPNTVQGVKGSLGLFQINLFWIQKTTYYPRGYLQTVLNREFVPTDLFDVDVSIASAQALIRYDRAQAKCGWSAWLGC
jgi:hypothetical protein